MARVGRSQGSRYIISRQVGDNSQTLSQSAIFTETDTFYTQIADNAGPLDAIAGITGAWSASRNLLSSFGAGSRYTDAGAGAISSFTDQTGNGRHLADCDYFHSRWVAIRAPSTNAESLAQATSG